VGRTLVCRDAGGRVKTSDVLSRARELIAGGWHEPLSLDVRGHICPSDDEGIARFSTVDALAVAALGDVALAMRAEDELARQLRVAGVSLHLTRWLEESSRTHAEVLRLFARAHAHAVAGETRCP